MHLLVRETVILPRYYTMLLGAFLILFSACGEKSKDNKDLDDKIIKNEKIFPEFVESQKLICDTENCPEFLTKITVITPKSIRYCTGTLLTKNLVVTSAQCLPSNMRAAHLRCDNSVFFTFAKTSGAKAQTVGCNQIKYADRNITSDPALWSSDLVFFKLSQSVNRLTPDLMDDPLVVARDARIWKLSYIDELTASITESVCDLAGRNYLYPHNNTGFSSMVIGSNCGLEKEGNLGAPIFSGDKLVGVYSVKERQRLLNFLKIKGYIEDDKVSFEYFSRLTCSSYLFDGHRHKPSYCKSNISFDHLDRRRSELLAAGSLHSQSLEDIRNELETPEKYFLWRVEFRKNRRDNSIEVSMGRPKCIYNSANWIWEFKPSRRSIYTKGTVKIVWPNYLVKTKLDSLLRPYSEVQQYGQKNYSIEFNPFNAHVNGNTYTKITESIGNYSRNPIQYLDIKTCN